MGSCDGVWLCGDVGVFALTGAAPGTEFEFGLGLLLDKERATA